MKRTILATTVLALGCAAAPGAAGQSRPSQSVSQHADHSQLPPAPPMSAGAPHAHGTPVPAITYAELQRTAEQLAAARQATMKYQDVRAAEADGYRAIGPYVPGMGVHYVLEGRAREFSIAQPPILLYERDPTASAGLRLVGVSYLVVAPSGADGQPAASPFPKALASWHKHNNVCVLPDKSASVELTEAQCSSAGGHFSAETSWMLHAWIWKDSPDGVFSPTNSSIK
jgi:hypothetical protein